MSKILLWIADNSKETIFSIVLGGLITTIFQNRKNIVIWIKTFFQKEKEFRISYAYLFRIKIENKYLLIKGKRIEQYQPVGGVFKYYNSFIDKYNLWEIKAEKNSNFFEEKDLRIFVKGKYLTKFLDWIETNQNRECDCKREFIEELIVPGYLQKDAINNIQFEFLKRVNSGIHYSAHFKCQEILIFDIYEVSNLSESNISYLKQKIMENDNLILVTAEDIEKQCVQINDLSRKIGAHASHII